jgi:hypothetical protein
MVQLSPLPDFRGALDALTQWMDADTPPPVEQWHPAHRGSIDIRIAPDGRWFHESGEITRAALVRLFSRVLRREEDGSHVLVTPAEQLTITVDDAAFAAVDLREEDGVLLFQLNTGEVIAASADHPLVLREGPAGTLPYLHVRGSTDRPIEARPSRAVYYALAEMADATGHVTSGGERYAIGAVA